MMLNVLVVEDNESTMELLKAVLDRSGYQAEFAIDGNKAWEILSSGNQKFSILITDFNLPGMNGIDLIKKAISEKYQFDLVILISSLDRTNPEIKEARAIFPQQIQFQFIDKCAHGFVPTLLNELKRAGNQ